MRTILFNGILVFLLDDKFILADILKIKIKTPVNIIS